MPPATSVPIGGRVQPPFDAVAAAFAENFTQRDELGASLCIVVDGTVMVDLWGGWQDADRVTRWERDTLINVFSVGKAATAVCVARLVGEGRLSFDEPVVRTWPEFAAGGKSAITVRQLLSHQAGLPAIREVIPTETIFNWETMCATLAAHEPWWDPGTAHGYHVNTFGFLAGEVIRRASGMSPGTYFRREVAGRIDADFFIGLPVAELHRVGDYIGMPARPAVDPTALDATQVMELHAYFNPPELSGSGVVNTTRWRTAELPSTNGHATARGIARLFEALAAGGTLSGVDVVAQGALAEAAQEQVYGEDLVLHRPSRFGIGFQLTQAERPLGPNPASFGHFGAGGSLGFCDPDANLAFGYAINTMGPRWQNPRNAALIEACYSCL
ncbi:MAG TPA: serine hydrolase domain-containing protein [Acidimicrobiales bacterium]|nr:serine hydrolase domain-containing protein [Acidimicrobiales bacterium]